MVRHYHGGLADWTAAGLPVESGVRVSAAPEDGKRAATVRADEISAEEMGRRLHDPALRIVDVRPVDSYIESHVAGALNIPLERIQAKARQLLVDPAAEIVVYDGIGREWPEHAAALLRELGYSNVRIYSGSIAAWAETAIPAEIRLMSGAAARSSSLNGMRRSGWGGKLVDLIDRQPTSRLFMLWLAIALFFGMVYWLAGLVHHSGLAEGGRRLDGSLQGLISALYFSFVTVTSVGYGDIIPLGMARIAAVVEAILGLLVFGAVISKFVSRRQDQVVAEIHRITFDERLDRIQTNLHTVLSEFQLLAMMFSDGSAAAERINARLESSLLVFVAELRTVHSLLYRPDKIPEETVMAGILASLASALGALEDCLHARPDGQVRSPLLTRLLRVVSGLAGEICADCVPAAYAPILTMWMDRIHEIAGRVG